MATVFARACSLLALAAGLAAPARAQEASPDPASQPPKQAQFQEGSKAVTIQTGPDLNTRPQRSPLPQIADPTVAKASAMLTGSWASTPGSDGTALWLHAARVDITGVDNAVYFEIARADNPGAPFRQGVFVFWMRESTLRLRVLDLSSKGLGEAVVGLWADPSVFPALTVDQLIPNVDLRLKADGDGWVSEATGPVPTTKLGAWEVESWVSVAPGALAFRDRGTDVSGNAVFGGEGDKPLTFARFESPIRVHQLEGGIVSIDMVPPKEGLPVAQDNTLMAINYTGWLPDGMSFGTSKGKGAQQIQIPANFIAGFNKGLPGMTKGTLRRLWIPSGMAFGKLGNQGFRIPPDTPVIFELECVYLEHMPPPATPEPVPPIDPAAPQPGGQPPNQ